MSMDTVPWILTRLLLCDETAYSFEKEKQKPVRQPRDHSQPG